MKIRLYASTSRVGSKVETILDWDKEEWEAMSEEEREKAMLEDFWSYQLVNWGYEVVEEED